MSRVIHTIASTLGAAVVAGLQLALTVGSVQADVITSAKFTFGFGATGSGTAVWTTMENSGNNSPTTQVQGGYSFSFSAAPTSSDRNSANGASFANLSTPRTLKDGSSSSTSGWVADPSFTVPIVAKYNGSAPSNVNLSNPNYQLTLEITSLGIYVGDWPNGLMGSAAGGLVQWDEITSGHSLSPLTTISPQSSDSTLASNYTHLEWNPTDAPVTLAGLNDSVIRTFTIPIRGGAYDYRYADGIEVVGYVHLSYNAVPEPSTLELLATSLLGLLAYAWRRRR